MTVKYPEIEVQLTGTDGNAFAILGTVQRAMRKAGLPAEEISAYNTEATSGNYDNLLAVTMAWVEVF